MRIIGLLGGVASGKSLVARQMAELGAGLLAAARAGHEVLEMPQVAVALRKRWGDGVTRGGGRVDRSRVAEIVFRRGPEAAREREFLEKLTHPEIAVRLREQSEAMARAGTEIAVLDAPLLLEAGWDKLCEMLVFVDAPREERLRRAKSRGWSEEEFAAREAAQESLDSKRSRADVIIDNSGSPQRTRAEVERFWLSLPGQSGPA